MRFWCRLCKAWKRKLGRIVVITSSLSPNYGQWGYNWGLSWMAQTTEWRWLINTLPPWRRLEGVIEMRGVSFIFLQCVAFLVVCNNHIEKVLWRGTHAQHTQKMGPQTRFQCKTSLGSDRNKIASFSLSWHNSCICLQYRKCYVKCHNDWKQLNYNHIMINNHIMNFPQKLPEFPFRMIAVSAIASYLFVQDEQKA